MKKQIYVEIMDKAFGCYTKEQISDESAYIIEGTVTIPACLSPKRIKCLARNACRAIGYCKRIIAYPVTNQRNQGREEAYSEF